MFVSRRMVAAFEDVNRMFRPGSDSFGSSRDAALVRCAATWIDVSDNWWRLGNWWRISPPAVPIASVRGADS